jgi:hypothetical protein
MPIGSGIVYNTGDLILSQVSSSGTAFLETKIAAATSSIVYFDSTARINSASLNSITVGTASYVSGSTSIITNLTASNISASGTSSFGYVGIGTTNPSDKLSIISGSVRIASSSLAGALYLGNDGNNIYLERDNNYDLSLVQNGDSNRALYLASAGNVYVNIDSNNNDTDKAFIVQNNALKAGTELFRVSETGNVGIGTSIPNNKLDIFGGTGTTLNMSNVDDGNRGGKLTFISSSATGRQFYVGTNSSIYNLVFGIDSIEKARIDTNGNLGIGITSPTVRLHVSGSSIITNPNPGANSAVLLVQDEGTATTVKDGTTLRVVNNGSAANFSVFEASSGVSDFVILNNGNVGIGTISPKNKLSVIGSDSTLYYNTTAPAAVFQAVSPSTVLVAVDGNVDGYYAELKLGNAQSTYYPYSAYIRGIQGTGIDYYRLEFGTAAGSAASTRMTIANDGNVGIGTTNPVAKLQVSGSISGSSFTSSVSNAVGFLGTSSWAQNVVSASFATTAQTANALNTANSYTITGLTVNGNISASGTISASKLRVVGTANVIELVQAAVGSATYYVMDNTVETGGRRYRFGYSGGSSDKGSFTIYNQTDNITPFTITTSGSVGIGTTSPGEKLTVSGSSYIIGVTGAVGTGTAYYLGDSSNRDLAITRVGAAAMAIGRYYPSAWAETIRFTADGNVGIGTTSPATILQVVGTGVGSVGTINIKGASAHLGLTNAAGTFKGWYGYFNTATHGSDNDLNIKTGYAGTSNIRFSTDGDTTAAMLYIKSDGNVGIGTTSPVARLSVVPSGSAFDSSNTMVAYFAKTTANGYGSTFIRVARSDNTTTTGSNAEYTDIEHNSGGSTPFRYGTYADTNIINGAAATNGVYGSINFVTSGSTRMTIAGGTSAGNVGIGTTTPATILDVVGLNASFPTGSGTIQSTGSIVRLRNGNSNLVLDIGGNGGNGNWLQSTNRSDLSLTYPLLLNPNGGNVGIGTTVPAQRLDVRGYVVSDVGSNAVEGGFYLGNSGHGLRRPGGSSNDVYLYTTSGTLYMGASGNSSQHLTILTGGNVGIGTTVPNSKLEVAGTAGTAIVSVNNTSVNRSGSFGIDNSGVYIQNSNNGDYFDLKNASGTARFRVIYDNATHLTTNFVSIGNLSATGSKLSVFGNLSVGSTYGSTAAPSNGAIFQGSVGIGTTSPDSSLHVYSTSFEPTIRLTSTSGSVKTYGLVNNPYWATGSFHIYDFTTDNSRIHISSTGNIGLAVGSTTPANRLDVVGDLRVRAAGAAMILDTATTSDGRMEYKYNGTRKALIGVDSDNLQISADSGNFLQFRTNNTQRMIINNSGGVGIGTSSPLYLVDIYDTGANSAMMSLRSSGSGNARIYFDAANGDLVGSDYCYLGQDDSSLDFIINTGGSAGNIHLQPKEGTNNGILYVSGSTRFGRVISQTHEFTGSINLSGSLNATASWANNVVSASYATTAQTANALNTGNSYTIAGLTNNGTLSQQNTLSMGSGYQILATTGTTSNPGIAFVGDTNTGIYSSGADTIGLVTGGSEKVTINSTGNVGIGTPSPGAKLDVVGGINSSTANNFNITSGPYNAVFYNNSTSSTDYNAIRIYQGASGSAVGYFGTGGSATGNVSFRNTFVVGTQNSNDFVLNTTDTERVRITSGGNVGIGTTTPNAKLDVNGNIIVTGSLTTTSTIVARNYIMATDTLYIQKGVGGYQSYITAEQTAASTGNSFKFWNSGTGTLMTIGYNGYVGIGTTSPTYQLHVNGGPTEVGGQVVAAFEKQSSTDGKIATFVNTTGSGYTSYIYIGSNPGRDWKIGKNVLNSGTTGHFQITNDLNQLRMQISAADDSITFPSSSVGIGTTNATDKLTVYGAMASYKTGADTIQTQVYLANGGNTRAFNLQLNSGGTGLDLWSYNSANAWLRHTTFDYDGRVGIGTAAPAAKLEISGSSNSALLHVKSPISGAILFVSGSGAVGIGTSAVGAFTLQVSGSFGATTKSFIIDHPTKAGKKLMYGSLESPYHGIRLTGRDTLKEGKCKIQLPDYIYKLILHDSVNIQLTGIKCNKTLYVDEINIPENYFTIAYDKAIFESYKDYDFFWDFTAIRADVPELNTEL